MKDFEFSLDGAVPFMPKTENQNREQIRFRFLRQNVPLNLRISKMYNMSLEVAPRVKPLILLVCIALMLDRCYLKKRGQEAALLY